MEAYISLFVKAVFIESSGEMWLVVRPTLPVQHR